MTFSHLIGTPINRLVQSQQQPDSSGPIPSRRPPRPRIRGHIHQHRGGHVRQLVSGSVLKSGYLVRLLGRCPELESWR